MAEQPIRSIPMVDQPSGTEHRVRDETFYLMRDTGAYKALCGAAVLPGFEAEARRCWDCAASAGLCTAPQPTVPQQRRRRGRGRHRREDMVGPWVQLERV
ncbi:hypothetical protein L3Q65_00210 (plasmid) [Amycolatopsis sp. FU40]|uniref:hypothetical protein n=1 Tax=Amycolatopsis sp. FU40 TaxID=2914159 RepID=UPI001F359EC5|nr:hypothetical protein [Amycolatopsis sp. FU40]UKD50722.1 hypothetical protein L3Q65_00210 [Amycolatopsis sp. FU40]